MGNFAESESANSDNPWWIHAFTACLTEAEKAASIRTGHKPVTLHSRQKENRIIGNKRGDRLSSNGHKHV
jgi:hypothetical protein